MNILKGKTVLITGGTGSFGKRITERILQGGLAKKIIIFSRDEFKQFQMQTSHQFQATLQTQIRYFIGDVRDKERLARAFDGVDIVVHAAALKQVEAAEYNPFEVVKTNILGAQNIINCAIDKKVSKVIALSTDKAVNPINLYGATKLCSDKLFIAGNSYTGSHPTTFAVVRYGNVVGSRGSVVPVFLQQRKSGVLTITDERMTRFWITLEQAVDFVLDSLGRMQGGELFVPKIPSMRILDLAKAVSIDARIKFIGIRPGEKLHEILVTEDDASHTLEFSDYFLISPSFVWEKKGDYKKTGNPSPEGFKYTSDTNTQWLTQEDLMKIIAQLDIPEAKEFALEKGLL